LFGNQISKAPAVLCPGGQRQPALSPRHPAKSGNHAGGAARATLEIWLPRLKFFFLAECKQRSEFLQFNI